MQVEKILSPIMLPAAHDAMLRMKATIGDRQKSVSELLAQIGTIKLPAKPKIPRRGDGSKIFVHTWKSWSEGHEEEKTLLQVWLEVQACHSCHGHGVNYTYLGIGA
jgi:hypothetical protein